MLKILFLILNRKVKISQTKPLFYLMFPLKSIFQINKKNTPLLKSICILRQCICIFVSAPCLVTATVTVTVTVWL